MTYLRALSLAGHNYVGHNYVGHNYVGYNYVGGRSDMSSRSSDFLSLTPRAESASCSSVAETWSALLFFQTGRDVAERCRLARGTAPALLYSQHSL